MLVYVSMLAALQFEEGGQAFLASMHSGAEFDPPDDGDDDDDSDDAVNSAKCLTLPNGHNL